MNSSIAHICLVQVILPLFLLKYCRPTFSFLNKNALLRLLSKFVHLQCTETKSTYMRDLTTSISTWFHLYKYCTGAYSKNTGVGKNQEVLQLCGFQNPVKVQWNNAQCNHGHAPYFQDSLGTDFWACRVCTVGFLYQHYNFGFIWGLELIADQVLYGFNEPNRPLEADFYLNGKGSVELCFPELDVLLCEDWIL